MARVMFGASQTQRSGRTSARGNHATVVTNALRRPRQRPPRRSMYVRIAIWARQAHATSSTKERRICVPIQVTRIRTGFAVLAPFVTSTRPQRLPRRPPRRSMYVCTTNWARQAHATSATRERRRCVPVQVTQRKTGSAVIVLSVTITRTMARVMFGASQTQRSGRTSVRGNHATVVTNALRRPRQRPPRRSMLESARIGALQMARLGAKNAHGQSAKDAPIVLRRPQGNANPGAKQMPKHGPPNVNGKHVGDATPVKDLDVCLKKAMVVKLRSHPMLFLSESRSRLCMAVVRLVSRESACQTGFLDVLLVLVKPPVLG